VNHLRPPSSHEKAVIAALLQSKPETLHLIDSLDELLVAEIKDGGMGSLLLVPKSLEGVSRSFGQQVVLGEFRDNDGILVSVTLNVDSQGNLYELDVWKVDFSLLLAWPDLSQIRIVS
jgi:hypothetical protein